MINTYLTKLDDLIFTAEEIVNIEILRRTIWDTELEKIGIYRYKIYFFDGSFVELTERLVEQAGSFKRTKYRYHWQDKEGRLLKRWDNANHHPEIDTFPHHLHDGSDGNVAPHREVSGFEVLSIIIEVIG
ncbi:MAG: hypothetical protein KAW12_04725 [Candidatus Aminicenantes bacterium]|nr:hypothetical protein [Candidatus Aminicenantes bacterium]